MFAGIWLSGIAVVSMPMIFGFITDPTKQQGDIPGWAIIPFLGLFWIIGLGVLYLGLRAQFAQYLLTVDGSMIALRREMFGRVSEKSIALDEVVRIVQKEFYQKNYQSVFGIEIEGKRSKLRFGSMLEDDEKAWLVADLRRAFMQPGDILPPMASHAPLTATPPAGRQSSFSFTLETPWLAILIPALIVLPVGIFFVCIGFWVINPGNPQDRGPDWVRLFGAAWLLMSSVVTISAASGALFVLRNRGARSQFDGDETNVSIRLMKGERSIREKWYPRSEVTTVKAVTRGKYGTTEMKRVLLLVGGKKIEIAKWVPAIEADQFVRAANAALHGK
ncbi:hypothetical protein OVA24_13975 [Luteolibacter sp. SL250]|uniref:hypothetical protein n=1 Tax=Luteolibacter sp. SL250 TaxID=2995170 RepID=UPI00226E52E1|nr:hypothetical protein [Luteolibacter sp. SL250]WAC18342.1 hypothetical protein OVA24_13975 [Luteolibacter sp. SL250]